MNEQVAEFAALAEEMLVAGEVDELIAQLADPSLTEEWDDPDMLGAVAEVYGRNLGGGQLLDVAALRCEGVSLLLPAAAGTGTLGIIRGTAGAGGSVAVAVDGELRVVSIESLETQPVGGIDPDASIVRVSGEVSGGATLDIHPDDAMSRAARFLAHELVGVADGVMSLALDHVRARQQFGVAIGAFQAVRHRLVDAHVQITAARELLAAIGPDADTDTHTLVLKSSAGAAAQAAVAAAQQVTGGMGFTEEFGLHRFVRRVQLLDHLFEGWERSDLQLGERAVQGHIIPDRQVVLG